MKATGMVRKVDSLGRVVIPKELRDSYGWEEQAEIEMYIKEDQIHLRKVDAIVSEAQTSLAEEIKQALYLEEGEAVKIMYKDGEIKVLGNQEKSDKRACQMTGVISGENKTFGNIVLSPKGREILLEQLKNEENNRWLEQVLAAQE